MNLTYPCIFLLLAVTSAAWVGANIALDCWIESLPENREDRR